MLPNLTPSPGHIASRNVHFDLVHGSRTGTVLVWEPQKSEKRWTKIHAGQSPNSVLDSVEGAEDTYISVNQFHGWRDIRCLHSLQCCFVDIDGHQDLDKVLDALLSHKIPPPTFVIFSGRGMHLYWTLEPTPGYMLPRWQVVENALVDCLKPLGADPAARDATRVLRLAGTVNSKNCARVNLVMTGTARWTLDELAFEVLGDRISQADKQKKRDTARKVHDLPAAAARVGRPTKVRSGSIYDWWYLVYSDLRTIADSNWPKGVTEGKRDIMLFLMGVALSWFTNPEALENEILATALQFTPTLPEEEVWQKVRPILDRVAESVEGKTREFKGGQYDPRYYFKAETIREWLGSLPPELEVTLRALAPPEIIKQRKKDRDATRDRVKEGRYKQTRDQYLKAIVVRAKKVKSLFLKGTAKAAIATLLKITVRTINRILAPIPETSAPSLNAPPPEGNAVRDGVGPVVRRALREGAQRAMRAVQRSPGGHEAWSSVRRPAPERQREYGPSPPTDDTGTEAVSC